ncbi:MAG: hypothetical protein AAF907_14945, partial [Planctomycetota bacterium]
SGPGGASLFGGLSLGAPGLTPQPDPIFNPAPAYAPRNLQDDGPAPAPLPLPIQEDAAETDGFQPVPPANPQAAPMPPRTGAELSPSAPQLPGPPVTLPPGTVIRNGVPVRDLRPRETYSPPPPPVGHYGATLPPTGVPFGAAAGIVGGTGIGAGPLAALDAAGGMCESGLCHGAIPLFRNLDIEDPDHIHPLAVRQVVAVADPSQPAPPIGLAKLFHRGPDPGCVEDRALVFVEVCVPPCPPEEVKVTRHGHRVHMDFGKYEVTLTSRRGYVKVDYDD